MFDFLCGVRGYGFCCGLFEDNSLYKLDQAQLTTRPGCVCSLSLMAQLAAHRHLGPVLDTVSLNINGAGQHIQQVDSGDRRLGHMGSF